MNLQAYIPTISSIVALLIGAITGYNQYKTSRSTAKKLDTDAAEILINKAMEINKQELEVVRSINFDLRSSVESLKKDKEILQTKNDESEAKIEKLEDEIQKLENINNALTLRVQTLEGIVEQHKSDLDKCLKQLK